MRTILQTIVSGALVAALAPATAAAGPLHANAFDRAEGDQPGATLEYDAANRLRRVKRGSLDIRYVYDGLGHLEAEIVDDGEKVTRTDLMVDESGPLPRVVGALTDDGGHELYAYGPMGAAVVRKNAAGEPPTTYQALTDELGTVRGLADGGGALAGRVAYGPFGRVRATEGEQVRLAFAGEYRDTAGLVWLRARHYAPFLGRFLQRDTMVDDPGDPQTLNRYGYAANNPLSNIDPTGHVVWFVAYPAAILVGLMVGTLVAPLAVALGDKAGGGDASTSADTRAEMEKWMVRNQQVSDLAGAVAGVNGARGQSTAPGASFGVGGINGPKLQRVTPGRAAVAPAGAGARDEFRGVMRPQTRVRRNGLESDCVACAIAEHYGTTSMEIVAMEPDFRPKPGRGVNLETINAVFKKSGLSEAQDYPDLPTFGKSVMARVRSGQLADGTGFVVGGEGRKCPHAIYMQVRNGRLRAVDQQAGVNSAAFIDNTGRVRVWELPPVEP